MVERFIHHRIGGAISILQTFRLVAGWLCGVHVQVDFSGEPFVAQFAHSTNRSVQLRTQNWDSWRPRDQFPNPHPHEFQCEEVCPITHPDTVPASSATAPLGRSAPREEVCPIAALSRRVGCSSSRKPSSNPKQAEVCPIVPPSPHPTPTSSPPCRQASPPPSANLAPTQCEEVCPIATPRAPRINPAARRGLSN